MPLTKIDLQTVPQIHIVGVWKITEEEFALAEALQIDESVPLQITHPQKRLEFLAARVLLQSLLLRLKLTFEGLTKDEHGKPFLKKSRLHISLSHSYPFVAAIISEHNHTGIDLEQPKQKLLRIAPRIFSPEELHDAGNDLIKHCIYWCAKEALIKVHGKKDLTLAKNLKIEPFKLEKSGKLIGNIIDLISTKVNLRYETESDYVLVFTDTSN